MTSSTTILTKNEIQSLVADFVGKKGLRSAAKLLGCSHTTLWTFLYRDTGVPGAVQKWLRLDKTEVSYIVTNNL